MQPLGRVNARCRSRAGFRRLDDELLSDLDCTTDRLLWALRESASSAGGELLVGAHCSSRPVSMASRETQLQCAAEVARYIAGPLASPRPISVPRSIPQARPAPSAGDVLRIDEPDASLSFRISLDFEPSVPGFDRPVRRGDQVRELPQLPLADQSLGDLVARCEDACDERALRNGLLVAAGRLGAPDVVGVRCYSSGSGNACVGTLAAPERSE